MTYWVNVGIDCVIDIQFLVLSVESNILTTKEIQLLKANTDIAKYSHWKLIFSGRVDGDGASKFHTKCDGKKPILVVVKSKSYDNVFGGYSHLSFHGPITGRWIGDNSMKNWLFRVRCAISPQKNLKKSSKLFAVLEN